MAIKCPICLNEYNDDVSECSACGFKFSGSTQKFKPVVAKIDDNLNTNNTHKIDSSNKTNSPILRIISGPQGEIILPLTKNKITIGRSPESDIFLNDRTVSREHAMISINDGVYQIVDRNSYNGLWVNNKNVSVQNINDGDIIQVGVFFLRFEI